MIVLATAHVTGNSEMVGEN